MNAPDHGAGELTVVLPTYNHGHLLPRALDSLLAQRRLPDRILVIDDGSVDGTQAVLRSYAGRCPALEVVTHPANRGIIAALNSGLELTRSEFVTFLAADDHVEPALCADVLGVMRGHPQAPLCGVRVRVVGTDGRAIEEAGGLDYGRLPRFMPPDEVLDRLMRTGRLFHGNGTVYRTGPLKRAGGFSPELRSFCDGYLIQLLALGSGACYHPGILATWCRHAAGYSSVVRNDSDGSARIIAEVARRTGQEDAGAFPPAYRTRLLSRLRYWAFTSGLQAGAGPFPTLLDGLSAPCRWALRSAARMPGAVIGSLVGALVLRPWDIIPALRRRFTAAGRP